MHVETGKIYQSENEDVAAQMIKAMSQMSAPIIPIDEADMTPKQKETMQVSVHDNKSVLGKKRIKESRRMKNRRRREGR